MPTRRILQETVDKLTATNIVLNNHIQTHNGLIIVAVMLHIIISLL